MDKEKHTATFYVQVKPDRFRNGGVKDIKAINMTQQAPRKPEPGSVTICLNVTLPDAVFMPLNPTVDIVIPEDHVVGTPDVVSTPVPVLVDSDFASETL